MARGVWTPTDPTHLSARQAARLLHVQEKWVHEMARAGVIRRYGTRCRFYYLLADVEALARDAHRLRRAANQERVCAKRRNLSEAEFATGRLINSGQAAMLLGTTPGQLYKMLNAGKLASYQAVSGESKHWFLPDDIVELRQKRAQEQEERAKRPPREPRVSRFVVRHQLQRNGPVGVGDLSAWERYLGDWLTTRQVAFMLHVTQSTVCSHRRSGRLDARRMGTLVGSREQWHFRKADVLALMEEPMYNKNLRHYHQHCSPEARARRAAEVQARQKPLTQEQQKALAQTARVARNEWLRSQP